jgi:glycosyltransferase involved in cell wall biosynthesis
MTRTLPQPSRESTAADWLADRARAPMTPGAVVLHAPATAFQAPGGGEVQLVQTARHLDALGVAVRPFGPWTDRLRDARLLHLFGMSREGLALARHARSIGLPVVLSPICWFEPRALAALAGSRLRAALNLGKLAAQWALPARPGWRRELLNLADRILPNSAAEARQLARLFAVEPGRFRVVPNGVEARFAEADGSEIRQSIGLDDFVLHAGRIEPRKNPLGLIRALRPTGLPLVVVGEVVPGHEGYAARCRREGEGFVRWVGRLDHDSPRLASAYAAARAFALPSWFETPGLSALEAALAGSPVVVTPYGCTREYFGPACRYARPDRPREIARAVLGAWDDGPNEGLRQHVQMHYLWPEVARRTAEVYDQLVG